jgi:creatinine amidohydrolase
MAGSLRLGDRSWTDLDPSVTVLVPVGSCEQHGPHLPLDTDTRIAVAVADGAAGRLGDALVAPAVAYGASGEHAGFAGTLSLGTAATRETLIELGRSGDWAKRLVFVNGHGGNHEAIRAAVDVLRSEGRRVLEWWPTGEPGDLHAGRIETSVMLHLVPSLVGPIPAPVEAPTIAALIAEGVMAHSPSGVLGDPSGATAAEGARILAAWIDGLVNMIESESS